MSNISSEPKYIAQPVVGTRGKSWQIVNSLGGLIKYFDGTKKAAEAEARRLETQHVK
jgi:hypothetical protein